MTDIKDVRRLNAPVGGITPALTSFLEDLYRFYQPLNEGTVAQNIPELAKANPDWFGICAVDVNGKVFDIGHTTQDFSIQSISKPFVYGLALEDWGKDYVLERIGVEPTGEPFNSIMEPEEIFRRHYNPMVNAGAIVTTSLIKGSDATQRYNRLLEMFRLYIGRNVSIDSGVCNSKQISDHLNRAIAYMMLNFGLIEGNINDILNLYFQQCSLTINCHDLAVMASTLANGGLNPMTGEQAVDKKYVENILSIMYTCGLYEFSGQWAYKVGLPAKSGLSGAIIGVVPNQMGIAVFSPALDKRKKSWRGVKVFEALSERFKLHIFTTDNEETSSIKQQKVHFTNSLSPKILAQPDTRTQLNLPSKSLPEILRKLHRDYLPVTNGKVYVSEPGLVEINPDWFAICIATVDGQVYCVGDWEESFLIQSISKVFAYGLALEDKGRDYVLTKVDVEPTGDAYNSIIKVESKSKRPYNSMVNTGAIATTSLIEGAGPGHKLNRILEMYRRYIGRRVFVDTPILVSEQNNGDRNWAISYLLRNFGMISGDISQTLHLYLQQCSVIINCRDLALMGATLANNGINPVTKERAINSNFVKDLLSVMFTCGMYDFAGEWVYKVGFPAKSGVGGGIIGVVPNQMGIAVFSPPLDSRGNSVRGIKVCEELSKYLGLHIFAD
ncbi:MAG: glutaminase A [Cyanobacteria bacterium J06643_5]